MGYEQQQHATELTGGREPLALPRLDLPRFQIAQPAPRPAPAPHTPAPPQMASMPRVEQRRPAPGPWISPTAQAPAMVAPMATTGAAYAYAPAPLVHHAPAPVYQHVAQEPPAPRMSAAAHAMANATHGTPIAWDRLEPKAEQTLLQKITPMHMGVLLVIGILTMVISSGPAQVAPTAPKLNATGGGYDPTATTSSTTPATATTAVTTPATPAARTIAVGTGRLDPTAQFGGIPSAAASQALSGRVSGGGGPSGSAAIRLNGIPSPAAAEAMDPTVTGGGVGAATDDGVTLPTASERDAYAVESHYAANILPVEDPVELPAMTPAQSAQQAEQQVIAAALATEAPRQGGPIAAQ